MYLNQQPFTENGAEISFVKGSTMYQDIILQPLYFNDNPCLWDTKGAKTITHPCVASGYK